MTYLKNKSCTNGDTRKPSLDRMNPGGGVSDRPFNSPLYWSWGPQSVGCRVEALLDPHMHVLLSKMTSLHSLLQHIAWLTLSCVCCSSTYSILLFNPSLTKGNVASHDTPGESQRRFNHNVRASEIMRVEPSEHKELTQSWNLHIGPRSLPPFPPNHGSINGTLNKSSQSH